MANRAELEKMLELVEACQRLLASEGPFGVNYMRAVFEVQAYVERVFPGEPTPEELEDIPEVDFTRANVKRNPYVKGKRLGDYHHTDDEDR